MVVCLSIRTLSSSTVLAWFLWQGYVLKACVQADVLRLFWGKLDEKRPGRKFFTNGKMFVCLSHMFVCPSQMFVCLSHFFYFIPIVYMFVCLSQMFVCLSQCCENPSYPNSDNPLYPYLYVSLSVTILFQ